MAQLSKGELERELKEEAVCLFVSEIKRIISLTRYDTIPDYALQSFMNYYSCNESSSHIEFDYTNEPATFVSQKDLDKWYKKLSKKINKLSPKYDHISEIIKIKNWVRSMDARTGESNNDEPICFEGLTKLVDVSMYSSDTIDPIFLDKLDDIRELIKARPFSYLILGRFYIKPERIVVYVKNILITCGIDPNAPNASNAIFNLKTDAGKLTIEVLLHELFHAYHYHLIRTCGKSWSSSKYTSLVKETLAQTFEYIYLSKDNTKLKDVYTQLNQHTPDAYPYSGALGLIDYANNSSDDLCRIFVEVLFESVANWKPAEKQVQALYELRKIERKLKRV